ncbi:MAG: hypothetical protein L0K82_03435 [Pisciglobus halotolerans]|nr:hypothetical protein [Pisciglobus halotolerans]
MWQAIGQGSKKVYCEGKTDGLVHQRLQQMFPYKEQYKNISPEPIEIKKTNKDGNPS